MKTSTPLLSRVTFRGTSPAIDRRNQSERLIWLPCLAVVAVLAMGTPSRADVRLVKIGNPIWETVGHTTTSGPGILHVVDNDLLVRNTREHQSEVLGGLHVLAADPMAYSLLPGDPHEGPYDRVWREALAAAGMINTDAFVFSESEFPNGLIMSYVLVPSEGAPQGASQDASTGPIIPDDVFPIRQHHERWKNGQLERTSFDPAVGGAGGLVALSSVVNLVRNQTLPIIDENGESRDYTGLNWSHIPRQHAFVWAAANRPTLHVGSYEWRFILRDADNNGWDIIFPFDSVPQLTGVLGDFSLDNELDLRDLNILTQNVAVGAINLDLDLNGDDVVDTADVHFWVTDLKATRIGDANLDGDVDEADRTALTSNWTGARDYGALKRWSNGDFDADEDVDSADLTLLVTNWTGIEQASTGGVAELIYDAATGNVKIDVSGTDTGALVSFVLATEQGNLATEAAQFPFADTGTNTDATAFQIGQTDTDFTDPATGPIVDFGNIFPTGLANEAELSAYLSLAEYASDLGSGGTLELRVVPEQTP